MKPIDSSLKFFLNLSMIQAVQGRRFDARLSQHSISLTEFMILLHLNTAPEEKMRRIDLADKIGLTASAVTRLLAPMEKIGLVEREANARDARVSLVRLTSGGKRVFSEALTTATHTASDIIPEGKIKKIEDLSKLLVELGGTIE